MKKINKIINTIIISISTITFLATIIGGAFFYFVISGTKTKEIEEIKYPKYTKIYDSSSNLIEEISSSKMDYVKYEDIPYLLIEALLSIEDQEFFYHKGINEKRILTSLVSNIFNESIQGASTITQQIVKNTMLSSEKTYVRKIKEIYLSYLLEQKLTKEEILELYFNHVYFEKSYPGIVYASRRFFNKELDELNLSEIALLVGSVKSPSLYCPLTHPENAFERRNIVLKEMMRNKVITEKQYEIVSKIPIKELINIKEPTISYKYQAYLDVVYQEANKILNVDIFSTPLKIETYLDTSLQTYLDSIEENDNPYFDESVQIATAVIKNEDCSIQGIIGGRKYKGKKMYNRASSLKASPASSIKPIFTYALGVEKLNMNQLSTFLDEETFYPNTNIIVNNADKTYRGHLSLVECLGYSRNTTTISLLDRLIKNFSKEYIIDYLKDIGIFDNGSFTYSYALGGFTYGTNPIAMGGAYCMLANGGNYLSPSTIKRITSLDTNEILYERNMVGKRIISSKTASIITDSLIRVINGNYYGIKEAKPEQIEIAGKTGTNAYDKDTIKKYSLPSNVDKDIWFCGYSSDYTIAAWAGFDTIDKTKKTYFFHQDKRKKIPKYLFKNIMNFVANKNKKIKIDPSLKKIYIVKHLDKMYYPNEYIPSSYIDYIYVDGNEEINELPPLNLNSIEKCKTLILENEIMISLDHQLINDDIYVRIYGQKCYLYKIYYKNRQEEKTTFSSFISIDTSIEMPYKIEVREVFSNNTSLQSFPLEINLFSS